MTVVHGSPLAYREGCRCEVCSAAHGRRCKSYRVRRLEMGGRTTVDASEAREVLAAAAERMSLSAIGRHLGTSHTWVRDVIAGEITHINPDRARTIITTLRDHRPTDSSHVTALGARRRLQALHAVGYTWRRLSDETGLSLSGLKYVVAGCWDVIEARNDAAIREAFDRLCMTIPTSTDRHVRGAITSAQNNAARRGWPKPLEWDDIDDPSEQPTRLTEIPADSLDVVVVDRVLAGERIPCTRAEKAEVLRRAPYANRSLASLERQMGWNLQPSRRPTTDEEAA